MRAWRAGKIFVFSCSQSGGIESSVSSEFYGNATYDTGCRKLPPKPVEKLRDHLQYIPTGLTCRARPRSAQGDLWLPRYGQHEVTASPRGGVVDEANYDTGRHHSETPMGTAPTALWRHGPQLLYKLPVGTNGYMIVAIHMSKNAAAAPLYRCRTAVLYRLQQTITFIYTKPLGRF